MLLNLSLLIFINTYQIWELIPSKTFWMYNFRLSELSSSKSHFQSLKNSSYSYYVSVKRITFFFKASNLLDFNTHLSSVFTLAFLPYRKNNFQWQKEIE